MLAEGAGTNLSFQSLGWTEEANMITSLVIKLLAIDPSGSSMEKLRLWWDASSRRSLTVHSGGRIKVAVSRRGWDSLTASSKALGLRSCETMELSSGLMLYEQHGVFLNTIFDQLTALPKIAWLFSGNRHCLMD